MTINEIMVEVNKPYRQRQANQDRVMVWRVLQELTKIVKELCDEKVQVGRVYPPGISPNR